MIPHPTRSVPGGCLVGLFALVSAAFGGLCAYGLFLSYQKENLEYIQILWLGLAGSIIVFSLLTSLATGLHKRIGKGYDPFDDDEPRAKF